MPRATLSICTQSRSLEAAAGWSIPASCEKRSRATVLAPYLNGKLRSTVHKANYLLSNLRQRLLYKARSDAHVLFKASLEVQTLLTLLSFVLSLWISSNMKNKQAKDNNLKIMKASHEPAWDRIVW